MSFKYNSSGLRTEKTVNGETKQYFYSGDLLVSEYDGVEYTNFTYGPNGEPVGFSFSDPETNESFAYYYYLKNLQGDIIGIIDFKGEIECTYSYDAWGKFLGAYDKNGNAITHPNSVALSNPLRYRSYYYDDETGLYYLNSRYYNPEWGTFISADSLIDNRRVTTQNVYQYCGNNPINNIDSSGHLFVGALVGGTIGGLLGGLGALASGKSVCAGIVTGALAGAAIGAIGDTVVTGGLSAAAGVALCGVVSATFNFTNQVVNNYIEANGRNNKTSQNRNGTSKTVGTVVGTFVDSVTQVDYGNVAKSAVVSIAFAPISFASGNLVNTALVGIQPGGERLVAEIIATAFMEIDISLVQFIIELF